MTACPRCGLDHDDPVDAGTMRAQWCDVATNLDTALGPVKAALAELGRRVRLAADAIATGLERWPRNRP